MLKKILVSLFTIVVFSVSAVAFYIYFSIDSRVKAISIQSTFNNNSDIIRLDSMTLSPDTIKQYISDVMKRANVQGLAVSVVNKNSLVFQDYFGSRNIQKNETFYPGAIWYAASLSKPLFADIVLQLCELKLIHLDTPLYKYLKRPLPEYHTNFLNHLAGSPNINYGDLRHDERYKKITARMCLSHTTGLPNWRWLELDKKLKIKFEPGSRYSYSGEGMYLLQFVIEESLSKDLEKIAIEREFEPLGMNTSSFVWQRAYEENYVVGHDVLSNNLRIPKSNLASGAGSLSTTLEEYTSFFQRVLKQNVPRYRELITPQVRIRSCQQFGPEANVETTENDSINLSYGLGFGLYQSKYGRAFFKEGHLEGWQHYVVGFPDQGFGLVLLSNSDQAESIFKELIEFLSGNKSTPWYWEGYFPYDVRR